MTRAVTEIFKHEEIEQEMAKLIEQIVDKGTKLYPQWEWLTDSSTAWHKVWVSDSSLVKARWIIRDSDGKVVEKFGVLITLEEEFLVEFLLETVEVQAEFLVFLIAKSIVNAHRVAPGEEYPTYSAYEGWVEWCRR